MNSDRSDIVKNATTVAPHDIVAPISTRLLFAQARFLKGSPFLFHLPFLFWLIETMRPKSFVSIGLGNGVPYFGGCQAVDKLEVDAFCCGVACHEPGSDNDELAKLHEHNARLYADFSRLIAGEPRDAVRQFPDDSIDLLLVDAKPDQSLLDTLTHDWTRKLSRRGIVLLHGVRKRYSDGPASAFLERIASSYPTITFEQGDGLTVVLFGSDRNPRLAKLAELRLGMPGYNEVHRVFERLGSAHHLEWVSRREAAPRNGRAEENRAEQPRSATADNDEYHRLEARLHDQTSSIAKRDLALAATRRQLEKTKDELARVTARLEARFDEIATLTRTLEERERDMTRLKAELREMTAAEERLESLGHDLHECRHRVSELERELAETRAHRDAILASTSWTLTAPIRKSIDLLRPRRE